jgi:predicted nucleic acid-binding protein
MFLLDTGIVLALREARSEGGDPALAAWAERVPAQRMFVSALTLLELENRASAAAKSGKDAAAAWREWLDRQVSTAFEGRILAVDAGVVRRRAQIPYAEDRDGILAATALVHNLTLVTGNAAAYRSGRVKVLDPARYEPEGENSGDWREATQAAGGAWLRNLFIR